MPVCFHCCTPTATCWCLIAIQTKCYCRLVLLPCLLNSSKVLQVLRAGGHYVSVSCRDPDVRLPLAQHYGFRVQVALLPECAWYYTMYVVACCHNACLTRRA